MLADDTSVFLVDLCRGKVHISQAEFGVVWVRQQHVLDGFDLEEVVLEQQAVLGVFAVLVHERRCPDEFILPLKRFDLACTTVLLDISLQKIAHVHVVNDVALPDEVVAEVVVGEHVHLAGAHDDRDDQEEDVAQAEAALGIVYGKIDEC